MRKYLHIDLARRTCKVDELHGDDVVRAGRYLIAKTLLADGIAGVDPWSPENPLIFSAGPLAGIGFSNGGRISVGCRSPLTGGVKEANSGSTFGTALGHLCVAGLTLHGASDDRARSHTGARRRERRRALRRRARAGHQASGNERP